jgi:hypothetical protein
VGDVTFWIDVIVQPTFSAGNELAIIGITASGSIYTYLINVIVQPTFSAGNELAIIGITASGLIFAIFIWILIFRTPGLVPLSFRGTSRGPLRQ